MRPQLVIDCGGRVLASLLVMPDGQAIPGSQEIRNVARRHVSMDVLFDPRVPEHPDFLWEDALESLAKARAHDFFQRARRIGLRRPWDGQASTDALRLASPAEVLSSAAALADRSATAALPLFSLALLDALLEPAFAFARERKLAPADVDPILLISPRAGRMVSTGLQKLVRRRGYRRATIVRRELAAALTLLDQPFEECLVVDSTDDDLHVYRVALGRASKRTIQTVRSFTLSGSGWSYWVSRIAVALGTTASAALDRSLVALLTGSPESLPSSLTLATLNTALGESWVEEERRSWTDRLRMLREAVEAGDGPALLLGEIFSIDAIRSVFDGAPAPHAGADLSARGVAAADRWLMDDPSRTLSLVSGGGLRLDSLRGEAFELLPNEQLPAPGESCHFTRTFAFAGERSSSSFLIHLMWGTDALPDGNTTLSAVPLDLAHPFDALSVDVHLRRSRNGTSVHGTAEARAGDERVRSRFTHELEVRT